LAAVSLFGLSARNAKSSTDGVRQEDIATDHDGDGAVAQLRAAAIAGMPPPMYEGTEKGLVGAQGALAEPRGVATVATV